MDKNEYKEFTQLGDSFRQLKAMEHKVLALEDRINVEIKFAKMAHDVCNIMQTENRELWEKNDILNKELLDLKKKLR